MEDLKRSMKKKLSRILGVGLAVAMLSSMMVMAAPASAGTLSWGNEASITNLKANIDNIIAPTDLDVVDIAVAGDVIYAATSDADYPLYKSDDGGTTWASLANSTSFPGSVSIKSVTIASSATDSVAVLTSANLVESSTNGGTSWTNVGIPATSASVVDIALSPDGKYVAAAGATSAEVGEMWTLYLAMAQSWTARVSGNDGFAAATNIQAVEFSPNWATDKIITVISGNVSGNTNVRFQIFRAESGALTWNDSIAFFNSDWENGLLLEAVTGGLVAADIELPDDYLGNDTGSRIGFVGYAGGTTGGGVIRVDDTYQKGFATWSSGAEGPIGSIAYDESGKLLAGDYDGNQVYSALTPMSSAPKFSRLNSLKQPSGADKTVVGWSSGNAVATTSGDESAFSVSTDDGYSFNDVSLIDTALSSIDDLAVSADGSIIYLTSHHTADGAAGYDTSVWLYDTAWTRVYSVKDAATDANAAYLVRVAPDDSSAVYIASVGTKSMWVSKNQGETSWKSIPAYKLASTGVQDYVVQSADVVYAIDTAGLSKTSNAGASWGSKKTPTKSFAPYMVALAPNDDVLIGGSDGYVAFSTDGGATLTRTKIIVAGNVHVAADDGYADNNILYGGVGTTVKRGKADGTTAWATRAPTIDDAEVVTGLLQQDGIVYVLTAGGGNSALFRSLNLETAASTTDDIWSTKTTTKDLTSTPRALRASSGGKLWAVGTTAQTLSSFIDKISGTAPTMKSPADAYEVNVGSETGRAYNVTYSFDRQNTSVTSIQMQVSTESDFTGTVLDKTFTSIISTTTVAVIGPTGATGSVIEYMPGSTYYWRIRTASTGPMYSPWSETRSIVVAEPDAPVPPPFVTTSPDLGASDTSTSPTFVWTEFEGALRYEITVSEDADFTFAEYSHNVPVENTFYKSEELDYSTTYYWRVRGVTAEGKGRAAASGGEWIIGVFTTEDAPEAAAETSFTIAAPTETKTEVQIVEVPVPGPVVQQAIPDYLLWVIVAIGAVLIVALIILIVRTRRVA